MSGGVTFDTPVRKKDSYVAAMRAGGGGAVVVKIAECQILTVRALEGGGGYLAKIVFSAESEAARRLEALDRAAAEAVRTSNERWFRNNLSAEDMAVLFRPAVGGGGVGGDGTRVATVLISELKEPAPMTLDGAAIESVAALAAMAERRRVLRGARATCVVEAQGLYFYPRRYGVRWRLRSVALTSAAALEAEAAALAAEVAAEVADGGERRRIEANWEEEVAAFCEKADAAIAGLEAEKAAVTGLLAAARGMATGGSREWNDTLDALRLKICRTRILSTAIIDRDTRHPQ